MFAEILRMPEWIHGKQQKNWKWRVCDNSALDGQLWYEKSTPPPLKNYNITQNTKQVNYAKEENFN